MDYTFVAIGIFSFVYKWYLYLFKKNYKQVLKYDKSNKRVLICGFFNDFDGYMKIDHFEADGTYKIIINGDPIRSVIDGSIPTFDQGTTYFLTKNNVQLQENSKITIIDDILEKEKEFYLGKGDIIDYLHLIECIDTD